MNKKGKESDKKIMLGKGEMREGWKGHGKKREREGEI